MKRFFFLSIFLFFIRQPLPGECVVLQSDTIWSGEVSITEDVLIPEGVGLTILPGTTVIFSPSESTRTGPEYMSQLTELTVRGTLKATGTEKLPIIFKGLGGTPAEWSGIIVDGGIVELEHCTIQDADAGLSLTKGSANVKNSTLKKNRNGIIAYGKDASLHLRATEVMENDYGLFLFGKPNLKKEDSSIRDNRKKDIYSNQSGFIPAGKEYKEYKAEKRTQHRIYRDEVLLGDTIWQGRIEVDGLIRIPERSRLIIVPGTVIEFGKKDTNKDGIGENGLLIQGVIIAKGTRENPILFRSAEKEKRMGDWDAINIMNSDGVQNLVEYCQIENAYRGLHFHFSHVVVKNSVLRNNYRAIQFQESSVEISGTHAYGNKSVVQARDSKIIFTDNDLYSNHSGANFFRAELIFKGNRILNNTREGLRIREGTSMVEENLIEGNRYGLMVFDSLQGTFSRNIIAKNLETGLSLKDTGLIEIRGNLIQDNGMNGITIQGSRGVIKANDISGNGERGIGIISFFGIITENNISRNGAWALDLEGKMDVSAQGNWWGAGRVREVICDSNNEPIRGKVDYKRPRETPILFVWPVKAIMTDTTWEGNILIREKVTILAGATLEIKPHTTVAFSAGSGLHIKGRIRASGTRDGRIVFTSAEKRGSSDWDEVLLEYAADSIFSYCNFEYANWGIHSHFTNLSVKDCSFQKNYGGVRFRSGPVEIRNSLFVGNHIGIRAYRGNAVIAENSFTKNEIGIFVREKGGGLRIRRNNLFLNTEYNIRIGDFNDEDVDAKENFWGAGAPEETIFDERKEPGIGRVLYEPYAGKPFENVMEEK